ncbi:hypothetical protein GNI_047680 [Gregarina niphandrodes]|uniref:Uncharacterized protein n=1 Tax=Gregarina niphandrodes TaxID=110365 RepID=A0A023B9Q0_GRENI|nr:hypothetical protein GNI_047680 [Gregarina niphandrodes]EZG74069.1 hypothetical protein GNI_047680 [Gregarina niphandrodes]|eukprot:XP_011129630.1 hypothetical protein GNI_047680 [Gregarina niphandrodes]
MRQAWCNRSARHEVTLRIAVFSPSVIPLANDQGNVPLQGAERNTGYATWGGISRAETTTVDRRYETWGELPSQDRYQMTSQNRYMSAGPNPTEDLTRGLAGQIPGQLHALNQHQQDSSVIDDLTMELNRYLTNNPGASSIMDLVWEYHTGEGPVDQGYEELGPTAVGQSAQVQGQGGGGQLSTEVLALQSEVQSQQEEEAFDVMGHHNVELDGWLINDQNPGASGALDQDWDRYLMDHTEAGTDSTVDQRCERPEPVLAGQPAESPGQTVAGQPCVGEDAVYRRDVLQGLTARVLSDCLAQEETPLQSFSETEANELQKYVIHCFRGAPRKQNVNISFETCAWRALNLALFLRERLSKQSFVDSKTRPLGRPQAARSQFGALVDVAQLMVRRPPGVGDAWFLACTMHALKVSDPRNLELLKTLPAWSSNALLYRDTIPDELPRLPQGKEAMELVTTASKLQFWLHQAAAAFRSGEPAAVNPLHRASLVSSLRGRLGPKRFDEEIETWMVRNPPPSGLKLTASQRACWLLSWVPNMVPGRPRREQGGPALPSRRSELTSNWDAAADAALRSFVGTVIQECVEAEQKAAERYGKEWMDREGIMSEEGKCEVAKFAARWMRGVTMDKLKACHLRKTLGFRHCGWRWLHLAGVIKDQLGPSEVDGLLAVVERGVPRPEHVSPLWFLASVLRLPGAGQVLDYHIKKRLGPGDNGWTSPVTLHCDIFPHDFGPLPESQAHRQRLIMVCWTAHWLKKGSQHFGQSRRGHSVPRCRLWQSSVFSSVAHFSRQLLGDDTFGKLIALFRARLPPAANISDTALMDCVLKHADLKHRRANEFCKQFQLPPTQPPQKRHLPTTPDRGPTTKMAMKTPLDELLLTNSP